MMKPENDRPLCQLDLDEIKEDDTAWNKFKNAYSEKTMREMYITRNKNKA